jgi:hypothetical protein
MWKSVIPVIELARGVPVTTTRGGKHAFKALVDGVYDETAGGAELVSMHPHRTRQTYRWVVDLGDDQGFAYALRWYLQNGGSQVHFDRASNEMPVFTYLRLRHDRGETTDVDRLSLARALSKVA